MGHEIPPGPKAPSLGDPPLPSVPHSGREGPKESEPQGRRKRRPPLTPMLTRLQDPRDIGAASSVAVCIMLSECVLCPLIVSTVPYTEIDWEAYMSEVQGFMDGERNYTRLKGATGPLVYPAGFVYIFSALRYFTGEAVPAAQLFFILLYILNQALVLSIYLRAAIVPPWALVLLSLSKRIHSIFLLRLFNDCFAMAFLHASLILLQTNAWFSAVLLFSLAVSVKMNVLLFAPSLLLLLAQALSVSGVVFALAVAAAIQLILGAPFLLTFPSQYLSRAFDLGRVFIHHWSINFKFVPEHVFVSKPFALSLLGLHLALLLIFAHFRWCRQHGGVVSVALHCIQRTFSSKQSRSPKITPQYVAAVMLCCNFIGIVCARSLHYQFYSWYFHSLPLLLWLCPFPTALRLALFAVVELCWNVYPSTAFSSIVLLVAHIVILFGLFVSPVPRASASKPIKNE